MTNPTAPAASRPETSTSRRGRSKVQVRKEPEDPLWAAPKTSSGQGAFPNLGKLKGPHPALKAPAQLPRIPKLAKKALNLGPAASGAEGSVRSDPEAASLGDKGTSKDAAKSTSTTTAVASATGLAGEESPSNVVAAGGPTDAPNSPSAQPLPPLDDDSDKSKTDESRDEADLLSKAPDEPPTAPLSNAAAAIWQEMVDDEVCSVKSSSTTSDNTTPASPAKSGDKIWTSDTDTQSTGTPSEPDRPHHGGGEDDEEAAVGSDQDMATSDTETSSSASGVAVRLWPT